ncbi:3-keto-5-aminohexanoate cleavage protein [Micromonospora polyrhachis]|uniref:Uncharacterized protein (DUF849 family) n=1 Tax=Micromonospora polyrhachis TaxID=1282883 RepID=A0A7W7WN82_9ACTN|nr:3-keto-5-aminohexanoate cleavage protein [Micromonospora polyrhachis]MBB4957347.1 uncharacterized protein (DUF849 family) [Micromonospora polyrhachis]
MLKVCLNGGRTRAEHPALPITVAEVVTDTLRCRAAGAAAVHVHPRDDSGRESLDPMVIAATVTGLRQACPELPVGVSTGDWIEPDPDARVAAIRAWPVLPDFASVNAHESGAERVAATLWERGVAVEAGLWAPEAVEWYRRWTVPVERILVECVRPDPTDALADAERMLADLPPAGPPVLLHGEGPMTWDVLREAVRRGLSTRIGLEDTTVLPDGVTGVGNAELVAAAVALGAG